MKKYQDLKHQILKDPEIKREYDRLGPEYAIRQKLIELRLKKKMTQVQLARKLGTKQSSISRFENGLTNPTIKFLSRFSSAFGKKLEINFK